VFSADRGQYEPARDHGLLRPWAACGEGEPGDSVSREGRPPPATGSSAASSSPGRSARAPADRSAEARVLRAIRLKAASSMSRTRARKMRSREVSSRSGSSCANAQFACTTISSAGASAASSCSAKTEATNIPYATASSSPGATSPALGSRAGSATGTGGKPTSPGARAMPTRATPPGGPVSQETRPPRTTCPASHDSTDCITPTTCRPGWRRPRRESPARESQRLWGAAARTAPWRRMPPGTERGDARSPEREALRALHTGARVAG